MQFEFHFNWKTSKCCGCDFFAAPWFGTWPCCDYTFLINHAALVCFKSLWSFTLKSSDSSKGFVACLIKQKNLVNVLSWTVPWHASLSLSPSLCVQAGTIGSTSTSRCDATSSSSCCRRTFPPRSWWCFHGCRSGSTAGPCRPESPWVKQKLKKHNPFEMSFEEIVPEENLSVWNDESWLWHGSTSGEHTHACVNTQTSHTPPLLLFFWFVFCIEAFAALVMQTSGFPHWALLISLITFSWYDGMVLQNPLTGFYSSTTQCVLGLCAACIWMFHHHFFSHKLASGLIHSTDLIPVF